MPLSYICTMQCTIDKPLESNKTPTALFKCFIWNALLSVFYYIIAMLFSTEQNQSDCPRGQSGASRGCDWLGPQGQIQQKECFRGVKNVLLLHAVCQHLKCISYGLKYLRFMFFLLLQSMSCYVIFRELKTCSKVGSIHIRLYIFYFYS